MYKELVKSEGKQLLALGTEVQGKLMITCERQATGRSA